MKVKLFKLALCLLLVITVGGCHLLRKKPKTTEQPEVEVEEIQMYQPDNNAGVQGSNNSNSNIANVRLDQIFYFDYDSYNLKAEAMNSLNAHASALVKQPNVKITLIGHTDERGTREYNMALGERRAKAVREYLILQGVKNNISIVSYGKELPAVNGSNESAWAQNRRVELFNNGN